MNQGVAATCLQEKHINKPILQFCVTETCKKTRALCMRCTTEGIHSGHNLIDVDEQNEFLKPKQLIYERITAKLNELKHDFNFGIDFLIKTLASNYNPPADLTQYGVEQMSAKISQSLKLDFLETLIVDRLDSIVEQTLKQMKYTFQDLTLGLEKECYEFAQKQQWEKYEDKYAQVYKNDSKNIMLQLSRVEALVARKDYQSALDLCNKLIQQDRTNPWIKYQLAQISQYKK